MNSVPIHVLVVYLCFLALLSSRPGVAHTPQQKQTAALLQSCLLFMGQAAFSGPPAAFFLKDNKESSFSDKLNINQSCLSFISHASGRKCDTNTTWGGGSKLQGTPVSGGAALIVLCVWAFFSLYFLLCGPFARSFLCFLIDMIHSSLCGWALSSLQPKWRLSVPLADEVNYLGKMLIRRRRLILEWFIPLWKKTLFYVPLYLAFLRGSESITAALLLQLWTRASTKASCVFWISKRSLHFPHTTPHHTTTNRWTKQSSDIPDVCRSACW